MGEKILGGLRTFVKEYLTQLRRYLMTGLLVWVPLIITLWVSYWVINKLGSGLDNFFGNVTEKLYELADKVSFFSFFNHFTYHKGYGFLIAILLFLTTGFLAKYLVTRKVINYGEYLLSRIPFINRVYKSVGQIRDVFIRRDGAVFQEVVLLEYPRPGLWVVGFITSHDQGIVQQVAKRELVAVFVPTTPNPTSGFLLYVPHVDLMTLDISIEEAMKLIISGGAYLPGKSEALALAEELKEREKSVAPEGADDSDDNAERDTSDQEDGA